MCSDRHSPGPSELDKGSCSSYLPVVDPACAARAKVAPGHRDRPGTSARA